MLEQAQAVYYGSPPTLPMITANVLAPSIFAAHDHKLKGEDGCRVERLKSATTR